ncbi:MAG TPA: phenylalanine--tRNA ligase subunit alpha [Patescibacteria group bacterium]|jgi:phenylalanyl-tRNA synthetase alpha chain
MRDPNEFEKLVAAAEAALGKTETPDRRSRLATEYLGRNGKLAGLIRDIKDLPEADRRKAGIAGNAAKARLEQLFDAARNESAARPAAPVDVTLPGTAYRLGHLHPSTLVIRELERVFTGLGFAIVDGPEVVDDWHNFEALNLGPDHPGRDMQDTFYLAGSQDKAGNFTLLPRTQTTAVTAKLLADSEPPIRAITQGRVFRNETEDATHSAAFHQLDAVIVDEQVSFADLKGLLDKAMKELLGPDTKVRFRPSYFPFTEPSAEIDFSQPDIRGGQWLELGGAGMLHPQVLRHAGIDPRKYRSLAFALGQDRIAMLKYGIDDVRQFFAPDVRLLEQF